MLPVLQLVMWWVQVRHGFWCHDVNRGRPVVLQLSYLVDVKERWNDMCLVRVLYWMWAWFKPASLVSYCKQFWLVTLWSRSLRIFGWLQRYLRWAAIFYPSINHMTSGLSTTTTKRHSTCNSKRKYLHNQDVNVHQCFKENFKKENKSYWTSETCNPRHWQV